MSIRDSLALRFGVTPEGRQSVVRGMFERHGKERAGYWFQLILAMGIATYGLVLGSTGVVIGAMLVSPLMSPLVEIGMGLVTGSAALVLHAALRTALSIVVVVASSAVLTFFLPYHEITSEIAARTAPTLLDLYVAAFCALAAAYTTARQSSDTVAAAAGTAISIALVPPLCVVGWGIGSKSVLVSRGAALLFTANLCAILLFTAAAFLLLRFDAVPTGALGGDGSVTDRVAARFHRFLGAKYGPAVRLLMPVLLVAAVFMPLRRALNEVAWKTRVRSQVDQVLSELPTARGAVQSSVVVANGAVSVRLVIVGSPGNARSLETSVKREIEQVTRIAPAVDVVAVPDEASVRSIAEGAIAPAPTKPSLDAAELRGNVDAALRAAWPSRAGELRAWRLVVDGDGSQTIAVVHFGPPLGSVGEELLHQALQERMDGVFGVRDLALSPSPVDAAPTAGRDWLPGLRRAVDALVEAKVGVLCVTFPRQESNTHEGARARDVVAEVAAEARAVLARLPDASVSAVAGDRWHWQFQFGPCPEVGDAGEDDAAARAPGRDAGISP